MKMHCIRRTLWGVTGLTLWLFCFTSAAVPQRSEDLRLFPVSVHGRIGFVDSRGRIGIKAHLLDYIGEFGAGNDYVTAKDQNGLWGIIDRKGSWRVAPKFEYMSIISEGAVLIRESGLYKFIDLNGRIFTPGFDYARPFSCGMAAVNKDGMWGYIDHFGNQVIPLRFSFDEGFANRLPFISPVNDFTEGLAGVNENGTTRYIFSDGSVAFSLGQGMLGGEFNDGRAIVCSKDKFGIIDKNGRIVIEPSYDEIKPFSDGLAAVRKGSVWGYLDLNGELAIPLGFDSAGRFSEGLSTVESNGKFGYIDTKGSWIVDPKFDDATAFSGGAARVGVNNDRCYIDARGRLLLCESKFQLNGKELD